MRDYLEALDEAFEQAVPRRISLTDPQSRWTAAPGGRAFFAYSTNYLLDTEHGVILDVEATPAHRTAEVDSIKPMVDRVEERFDITPERLIGDTAYGTAPMLAWMVQDKGIEPHVPVWDKTQRKDGSLSSSDFEWDGEANEYRCPEGHALRSERRIFKIERTHATTSSPRRFCPMSMARHSGVIVDQSQRTQAATIEQLVHDEVHAPDVIDGLRDRFGLATLRRLIALETLVPQRQALFPIQTVDPFVIVSIAFAAPHHVYKPVSVVNARMRYLVDSRDQRATVASTQFVAIQRPGNHDCGACLGHADAVALHQIIHEYAAPRRLHSFFARTSCNIALSSDRSATRRLSRLHSSSSWRRRRSSEGPSPPNFFFQL